MTTEGGLRVVQTVTLMLHGGNGNKDEGRLTLKVSERDESGGWQ